MSKFVVVDKVPENKPEGTYVVTMPDFITEIRSAAHRANDRKRLTASGHLRTIAQNIANAYDPEFNVLATLIVRTFEGREYDSDESLSKIVIELLERDYPVIFEKYLDKKIKDRPFGTKLIYFVGPLSRSGVFTRNGLDMMDEKDVDTYLGLKPKKVVGRPAVTKEEAEALKLG